MGKELGVTGRMQKQFIHLTLNGEPREWHVYPNELLLNVLREQEFL